MECGDQQRPFPPGEHSHQIFQIQNAGQHIFQTCLFQEGAAGDHVADICLPDRRLQYICRRGMIQITGHAVGIQHGEQ